MSQELGKNMLRYLEALADLCIVSVYWLVCCLPVVTIGASSSALYFTVTKVVRQEKGSLTSTFFTAFRQNFKQGIFLSLIFALCCVLLAAYLVLGQSISSESGSYIAYWVIVALMAVIIIGTFAYVFPLLARFNQKTWTIIRASFFLGVGYPIKTLGLICMMALALLVVRNAPLTAVLVPGLYALLASIVQEPVLEKHTEGKDSSEQ